MCNSEWLFRNYESCIWVSKTDKYGPRYCSFSISDVKSYWTTLRNDSNYEQFIDNAELITGKTREKKLTESMVTFQENSYKS